MGAGRQTGGRRLDHLSSSRYISGVQEGVTVEGRRQSTGHYTTPHASVAICSPSVLGIDTLGGRTRSIIARRQAVTALSRFDAIALTRHEWHGDWNYTIDPTARTVYTRMNFDGGKRDYLASIGQPFPQGESFRDLARRLHEFLDEQSKQHREHKIITIGWCLSPTIFAHICRGVSLERAITDNAIVSGPSTYQ